MPQAQQDLIPMSEADREQLTKEYLRRLANIEEQEKTLREDKKELRNQFKDSIDLKALSKARRIQKIQESLKTTEEEMALHKSLQLLKLRLERFGSSTHETRVLEVVKESNERG